MRKSCLTTLQLCAILTPKEVLKPHHATTSLATFGLGALKNNTWLSALHIPGAQNTDADGRAEFLMNAQNGS